MPISVKLAIDYHGRIPLLRNERGEWELPGGKLEPGETPEHAVIREVAEELGVTIDTVEILDTWVYEITTELSWRIYQGYALAAFGFLEAQREAGVA